MRTGLAEQSVQVERHARQVAEVLQQREQGEEDRHRREHDGDHPRSGQVHSVEQESAEPPRRPDARGEAHQHDVQLVHQQPREKARRVVGARDRDPEDRRQDRQHQRETEPTAGQEAVERAVQVELDPLHPPHLARLGDPLRLGVHALGETVVEVGTERPPEPRGRLEYVARARHCDHRRSGFITVAVERSLGQLPQVARAGGLLHALVGVEQPERHPACVGQLGVGRLDGLDQRAHRHLDLGGVALNPVGPGFDLAGRHAVDRVEQIGDPVTPARYRRHHRNTQPRGQLVDVDSDPVAPRLIHEVETHHHPVGDLQNLEHEVEVPLQPGGVHDDHGDVGLPEQHEVARYLLVGTPRLEAVRAGEVDQLDAPALEIERPLGARHRLAGPVAGVLAQTGECVEDGALPRVGIPAERDEVVPAVHLHPELHQRRGAVGGAAHAGTRCHGSHLSSPPPRPCGPPGPIPPAAGAAR